MTEKFVSIEPIFSTHEGGIKSIIVMSGEDAYDLMLDFGFTAEQNFRIKQIIADPKHPWMQEHYYYPIQEHYHYREKLKPLDKQPSRIGDEIYGLLYLLFMLLSYYHAFKYYPDSWIVNLLGGHLIFVSDMINLHIIGDCKSSYCSSLGNSAQR